MLYLREADFTVLGKYNGEIKSKSPKEVLDELDLERYCCRAMFLGTVDEDNIINFSNLD